MGKPNTAQHRVTTLFRREFKNQTSKCKIYRFAIYEKKRYLKILNFELSF